MLMLTKDNLRVAITESFSVAELAKRFCVSHQVIYSRIRAWGLSLDDLKEPDLGPSPEEIAERAAEVRDRWSPRERASRIAGCFRPRRWRPPSYRAGELAGVAESLTISRS
jgi:transposase